jgi:hypothetical protein
MSLTVKHLNADASFLLTFEPILPLPPTPGLSTKSFTIVLDPWLKGASKIWHPRFSISRQREEPCIKSLAELPEPDLVVISQDKTDHCHKETLTTLPSFGTKTRIIAAQPAAKVIRSWKYFDPRKVASLPNWNERDPSTVHRIIIPPFDAAGSPGEVTIAFIPQRFDITGLHNAIGITYRPPTAALTSTLSPIASPITTTFPLTPPSSSSSSGYFPTMRHTPRNLSVIFSPHGCTYKTLKPYAQHHLVPEACLPLTCLLHCFDRATNAWYLGGNICAGFPGGREIVENLLARCWISAHDAVKETRGFASRKLVVERFGREEVEEVVSPRSEKFPERRMGTEVVVLGVGEEMRIGPGMFEMSSGLNLGRACMSV